MITTQPQTVKTKTVRVKKSAPRKPSQAAVDRAIRTAERRITAVPYASGSELQALATQNIIDLWG